jgi:rfaE bifunctional protein nucleotidyltransferase chain/domain
MQITEKTIVVASGYFNPLHEGHVEYLNQASKLGDILIVIVNNDEQVKLKGSKAFMTEVQRLKIVRNLRCVDMAVLSIDNDKTVCRTLAMLRPHIFAKGGDTNVNNIPEREICKKLDIKIVDGLGGKINSSSWILKKANGEEQP